MRQFLEPRNGFRGLLSKFETACFITGAAVLAATWLLGELLPALSEVLAGAGVALFAAGLGSLARGLQWRRLLGRHAIDPNATVFYERGDYAHIVERITGAEAVDLLGISLWYALEYIKDHSGDYVRRVRHTRILLPATRDICDARDAAQGTEIGGLWAGVKAYHHVLDRVTSQHPTSFSVRFFTMQPYLAMTRVDGRVWVSPYVTLSGRSCPVIAVENEASPELFHTFTSHFNIMWQRSQPRPVAGGGSDRSAG